MGPVSGGGDVVVFVLEFALFVVGFGSLLRPATTGASAGVVGVGALPVVLLVVGAGAPHPALLDGPGME